MDQLRICVSSQTPLVQFLRPATTAAHYRPKDGAVNLGELIEGVDYRFSPGGVTRMVLPLVQRLVSEGIVAEVHWVSLNPSAPPIVRLPGVTLYNLSLESERLSSYGEAKEVIWGTIHGTASASGAEELFWSDRFTEYGFYNRRAAELIRRLDSVQDFDLFYIHDFQQLPLGEMLQSLKPKVLRWHIPFDATVIPELWRPRLASYLKAYDVIVVSSRRYLDALRQFGHRGRIVRMNPYIDPAQYTRPGVEETASLVHRFGIGPTDDVALVVARMDPMKGQDRAIRAFAKIRRRLPRLRLVLVGNGSFSGSARGLGLSKSDRWRATLEALTESLRLGDRVVFTGHVSQRELDALYERCLFTVLPSVQEGFGLVVVESWIHDRAAIVTQRAGVAELIRDGRSGLVFDPERIDVLARHFADLAAHPLRRRALARAGRRTSVSCTVGHAARAETRLFERLLEA